jgi:hypothetical protein
VDRLRRVSGATVLIIHHMGRNGEHMRGSTALEGAADTIIQVTKDDELVAVSCEKQKEDREFDDIPFKLVPVGDSVVIMPADTGSPRRARPQPSSPTNGGTCSATTGARCPG